MILCIININVTSVHFKIIKSSKKSQVQNLKKETQSQCRTFSLSAHCYMCGLLSVSQREECIQLSDDRCLSSSHLVEQFLRERRSAQIHLKDKTNRKSRREEWRE